MPERIKFICPPPEKMVFYFLEISFEFLKKAIDSNAFWWYTSIVVCEDTRR